MIDAIGLPRLESIIEATLQRTGAFTKVTDSPDGLLIHGTNASVLAWARSGPDGTLSGLSVDWEVFKPSRARALRRWIPLAVLTVYTALAVWFLCEAVAAASVTDWLEACVAALIVWAAFETFYAPATLPYWAAMAPRALCAGSVLSFWRLGDLPRGHGTATCAILLCAFGYVSWSAYRARSHQYGTPVSIPLRWPFEDGTWCIFQGGGKATNHHAQVPEQRAALDMVCVAGPLIPSRSLDAYRCYGTKVYAPCAGKVVSAADGIGEQVPGHIRYAPVYGNHVIIDTGHERVLLAHLRPGTVTVSIGDTVSSGELLGEVGNSGNTTEPHLHIHAEREGLGLDLRFEGMNGRLYRGRVIRPRN
ncbi:M23 family metallopeptidase [Streptomyces silvisoli]|uniref:M23 family metallopeptidase n=1 Tax=Streptomyces silvisoli TaxID=3034235 RepID=A0ABT5ZQE1_9ACTN|nr:M23 family metallopeptidase [Streptomyces silvisoli]MDF3292033.1 M23 family metallopeptidase [Streptomyces silvisoli]